MSNKILFISEGAKTEKQITDNLTKYFLNENTIIQCAFCTDIYQFHKEVSADEFLDTFSLLKEKELNKRILAEYKKNDFAEIYLFFDYDGHSPIAEDDKIKELLDFFIEETSFGKLFISYPMVEAIKHYSSEINFKELAVNAKENINYKNLVSQECDKSIMDLTQLKKENWINLINLHLSKMNHLVNDEYSLPTKNSSQIEIFSKQLDKHINNHSKVAVLSSYPLFLFDYYGFSYIFRLMNE